MNRSKIFVALMATLCSGIASAQDGSGSSLLDNGYRATAATDSTFEYAENLYIGPDAVWEINGVHTVYSKNIWIAAGAQISGNGKLIIADPANNTYYTVPAGATTVDGNNGNFITLNIEHHNTGNIILSDITDPGFATLNPPGSLAAALKIGTDFSFEVHHADVFLNGNDFIFGANATVSNYGPYRMVVTGNSIAGHMIKENTISGSFFFPVGIAERDYTPAVVSGNNTYYVSVQDYAASASYEADAKNGMDRTWHIFGGTASNVRLQHNSPVTDGALYDDEHAFITRYIGDGYWSSGVPEQSQTGTHTNTVSIGAGIPLTGDENAAYLSKTSNILMPLPITLLSFTANKNAREAALEWITANEHNAKGFEIEKSENGRHWISSGFVASQAPEGTSTEKLPYSFTDTKPFNGMNYYRLKQWSRDGQYAYSPVRNVLFEYDRTIQVYPNPAKDQLQVSGLTTGGTIGIYNVSGGLIYNQEIDKPEVTISCRHWANGVYYMHIVNNEGQHSSHKLVKTE